MLINLKNDIDTDILILKHEDSVYSKSEAKSKIAIKLFYDARTIKDIDSLSSLNIEGMWNELHINQNTYDEMINSGSMYTMKNKELQRMITTYYLIVAANRIYLREVNNEQSKLWNLTPDFYPFKLLISQLQNPQIDLNLIDITWINNPNSPTYLATIAYLNSNHEYNNVYRRSVYQRILIKSNELTIAITKELESRN